jgi:hypothetical protein
MKTESSVKLDQLCLRGNSCFAAVHTIYDPLVLRRIPNFYGFFTQNAGSQDLFVLRYVKHDGHCRIEPDEIGRAFQQLRKCKDSEERPPSG